MRLNNEEVLLGWPLDRHLLTAGNYYRDSKGRYNQWHGAIDLRCTWNGSAQQPVYAAEDGTVNWVQTWDGHTKTGNQSYGSCVKIRHEPYKGKYTLETLYAHLSAVCVRSGETVHEGDVIGYTGDTGASVGAHLHFEVRLAGTRKNPLCWLDKDYSAASGYQPYTYGPGECAAARPEETGVYTLLIGPMTKGDRNSLTARARELGLTVQVRA